MAKKLIVSLSPHVHGRDSVQRNMYGVCIALIPALLTSLYFFGLGAAIVLATSVAACVFFEWAYRRIMKKDNRRFGHPDRTAVGFQPAFQPADMDHPHRSVGGHRHR